MGSSSESTIQPAYPPRTKGNNLTFIRFYVTDHARSMAFYREVLGLREVRRLSPPTVPAVEVFLGSDDPNASLIDLNEINDDNRQYIVGGGAVSGSAVICFEVLDVEAAKEKAVTLGGKIVMEGGLVEWPGMTFIWALVDDPDGNHLELINYQ